MSEKYPRIPHLPFSPGGTNDDKRLISIEHFLNKPVIITEKIDGSNCCFTNKEIFSRTHSVKATHKSFDLAKSLHASVCNKIVPDVSIFGEWCAYVHDIEYNKLPGYFLVFGIREDNGNIFWEWDLTEHAVNNIGLDTVPVLFKGLVKDIDEFEELTTNLAKQQSCYGDDLREGIVIRLDDFISDFNVSIAKWVRADHPRNSDEHWMFKPLKKQGLLITKEITDD